MYYALSLCLSLSFFFGWRNGGRRRLEYFGEALGGNRTLVLSGLLLEIPYGSSPVPGPREVQRKGGSRWLPPLVWSNERE